MYLNGQTEICNESIRKVKAKKMQKIQHQRLCHPIDNCLDLMFFQDWLALCEIVSKALLGTGHFLASVFGMIWPVGPAYEHTDD